MSSMHKLFADSHSYEYEGPCVHLIYDLVPRITCPVKEPK
jgi:hypothetical protein